jgi:four helix bundle protein
MSNTNQLRDHTLAFALAIREFGKRIPMTVSNVEDLKQLIRSSGAIGANYIEAESSGKRAEYLLGIQQCGRETQATHYWLQLIDTQGAASLENQRSKLLQVALDLAGVFSKILKTSS